MRRRSALALLLLVPLGTCARAGRGELVVFAAASLREACAELGPAFEAQGGSAVVFNFAGSNLLARQIVDGAPCDVLLSAGAAQMDAVEAAGLVAPGSRFDLLGNALVVVQPRPHPAGLPIVSAAADLLDERLGFLALANPEVVPAGRYAREWLTARELWELLASRVAPAIDVRAALALVESGAAGAGIVYATDAAIAPRARVVLAVPAAESPRIVYPAAALVGAADAASARSFLEFLRAGRGAGIFRSHGFRVLPGGRQR